MYETHGASVMYPTTPDGRYFVVKGQLWHCANPSLNEDVRQRLVNDLMAARREGKAAMPSGDEGLLSGKGEGAGGEGNARGARASLVGRREP